MLEQRRQQYLSLLGVESYVPRRLLPGAAEPCVLRPEQIAAVVATPPELVAAPAANTDYIESAAPAEVEKQPQVAVAPLSLLEDTSQTVDEKPTEVTSGAESEAETKTETQASASTEAIAELNFVLTVWRIRDQLLVIDSREPGAAYPTDRLLQNMLRVIGYPLAQLPASDIIRWPVFTSNQSLTKTIAEQNQDREQARAMVQAYITAQMTKMPVQGLLCMGENAAQFALNQKVDDATAESNQWDIPVAVTPSLFSMLQEPMLKAKAWKALQGIVRSA